MFARLFPSFHKKKQAYELYGKLVGQARNPVFYEQLAVADTIDGRFDMILLHLFLVDRRLEREGEDHQKARRFIQEALIADMDRSLRELGVGDMSVGKEVKKMGAAWLGRVKAYTAAIAEDAPQSSLSEVIAKNVYRREDAEFANCLASYALQTLQKLASYPIADVLESRFDFPEVAVVKDNSND
ncbi:MAG: ubiquinol-cytochrome C chaperone [Alphaproteobacteria bacterium]|nr:ubiquinol-cytochrome C chaperone [Alphaproteobacteria bacterium]